MQQIKPAINNQLQAGKGLL